LPNQGSSSKDLVDQKVQQLEWHCKRKVDHLLSGKYKSIFKGRGLEFDEVRPYHYGDDVRAIDWNVTARCGKPHIKRFHEERDQRIIFLIDASSSFLWSSLAKGRREITAEFMAILGSCAAQSNDSVAMLLAGPEESWSPARRGRAHISYLLDQWLRFPEHTETSHLKRSIHTLGHLRLKQSIVMLFSDHYPEELDDDLLYLSKHHELICVNLQDPRDHHTGKYGTHFLRDLQGISKAIFTSNKEQNNSANEDIDRLKSLGIETLVVTLPSDPLTELMEFFHRRQKHISGETGG
jgi:uncharacterized protein (DUF58 family)